MAKKPAAGDKANANRVEAQKCRNALVAIDKELKP